MEIRDLIGESYRDDMTIAEINAALADRTFIDQEEVNKNFVAKKLFDRTATDLAAAKKQVGVKSTDAANLQTQFDELNKKFQISEMKSALIAQRYSEELAASTAEAMINHDYNTVLANQKAYLDAREKTMKDEFMRGTKPPAGGGGGAGAQRDYDKEIQEAYNNHNFALASALAQAKAKAESENK